MQSKKYESTEKGVRPNGLRRTLDAYAPILLIYFLATWFTTPLSIGDTSIYVDAILHVVDGGSFAFWDQGGFLSFWEFGHLLWRPLGWLFFQVAYPVISFTYGTDARASVTLALVILNWTLGLLAVICLHELVQWVCKRQWVVLVTTTAFILSNAFLNFSQSGCAYVPGLALLMLGLYLLVKAGSSPKHMTWKAILAGLSLAASIGMWLPYFLAIPAAVATPLLLIRVDRQRLRVILFATITCASAVILMYGIAIGVLGLRNLSEVKAWIASSSHGVTENKGISKVVFGLPRSLIDMGADSVFFKRFLMGDPYNPVTFLDLTQRNLWKLAFAYLFLLSVTLALLSSRDGRRLLLLLLVNAIPVVAFALFFAGGVLERYFPLFPILFISLGYGLCTRQSSRWFRYCALLFAVVAGVTNAVALSNRSVNRVREATTARVRDLYPHLTENSRVFVPPQDQLWGSAGRLQLEPASPLGRFRVDPIAILGTAQVPQWQEDFADQTLAVWESAGDVWISKRFFRMAPKAEWNWAEGEDKRITWAELYEFFSRLDTGTSVGGEDGFVLLSPSDKNKRLLSRLE